MGRLILFLCVYLFQIGNTYSQEPRINVVESKKTEGHISTLDRPRSTNVSLLPRLNIVQDKVEQSQGEVCIALGKKRGHCLPINDCPHINNDYLTHKEFTCNLNHQRDVGVCCPNNITNSESYNEDIFAASAQNSIVVPPPPATSFVVSVPDIDIIRVEGSLKSLGDVTAGCGYNSKTMSSIVKANKATLKEWPWMAGLIGISKESDELINFCGGTIISRTHILTAAHCILGSSTTEIVVHLGEHHLFFMNETILKEINVSRIIKHEEYDSLTLRHDIALLVLKEPIKYNTYMQPVCLPPPGPRYEDFLAVVTGWGVTSFQGTASPVLLEVPVPVWEQNRCQNSFAQIIYDTCMCAAAYEGGGDACQGDSGGPLVTQREDGRWEVIGVVSWGNSCGKPNQPSIYTRVNDYLDWIAFHMQ